MKKYLPFLIALFFSTLVMGQHIAEKNTLFWSKPIHNKRKATYSQFIGENESGVYVTKTTIKKEINGNHAFPILEVYDRSFNPVISRKLDVKNGKGKIIYENTVLLEENLYLFYSLLNIWDRSTVLMVQSLDTKTLLAVGDPKIIMETKTQIKSTREHFTDFKFDFSDDRSALLVTNTEPWGNKMQKIHLYVLNRSKDQDWGKEVELPFQTAKFKMVSQSVDNNGHVYLLGADYLNGEREKRDGKPNYEYVLMGYTREGNPDFTHTITQNNIFLRDMRISVGHKSAIICTGFYSNDDTYSAAGTYFIKLDKESGSVVNESYNDFPLDFLTQNLDKKDAKKVLKRTEKGKGSAVSVYKLDDLITRNDGSVTLVGERRNTLTFLEANALEQPKRTTGGTYAETWSTSKYYHYDDIIAVHLSPDGEIEWAEKIAKKQHTTRDFGYFSSYISANDQDKLYFIFNDHTNNLHYNNQGKLANFNPAGFKKKSAIAMVTLDAQGNKSKKFLIRPQNSTVLIKPKTSRQFSPGNLFLFAEYNKDFRLARMEF